MAKQKRLKIDFSELDINREKSKDTGMAMVLILLVLGWLLKNDIYYHIGIIVLIIDMIIPQLFKPLAYIWFGLALVLSTFVSKILLFIVFVLIVLPVAMLRKLARKDTLQLSKWKKGNGSVFKTRDHLYKGIDINKPY